MSAPGPKPKATVLRLIAGDKNRERFRDDRPQVEGLPELPADYKLTPLERRLFRWLLSKIYVPGVHGPADGPYFARLARLQARGLEADQRAAKSRGKLKMQWIRIANEIAKQVGAALSDVGASPSGRVRLAARRSGRASAPSSWDDV
jgi:hypothetical protein